MAILGLILATGSPAFSAEQEREYLISPERADDLVEFCRAAAELQSDGSSLTIYRAATCAAYMTGIADAIRLSHWSGQPGAFAEVCVPAEATRGQLVEALLVWASRHRLDSDRPAREAAYLALADTFPCQ
jgi:hypothetical protein